MMTFPLGPNHHSKFSPSQPKNFGGGHKCSDRGSNAMYILGSLDGIMLGE
jgi:hypothetical protein